MTKLITVCKCPKCDEPIEVPLRRIGQLIRAERKIEPTNEFMKAISKKGVKARKQNATKNN